MEKALPNSQKYNLSPFLNWGLRMAAYGASGALGARLITPLTLQEGVVLSLANATLLTALKKGSRTEREASLLSTLRKGLFLMTSTLALTYSPARLLGRANLILTPKTVTHLIFLNLLGEATLMTLYWIHDRLKTPPKAPNSQEEVTRLSKDELTYIFDHFDDYKKDLNPDVSEHLLQKFLIHGLLIFKTPQNVIDVKHMKYLELEIIHDMLKTVNFLNNIKKEKPEHEALLNALFLRFFEADLPVPKEKTSLTGLLKHPENFHWVKIPVPNTTETILKLTANQREWLYLSVFKFESFSKDNLSIEITAALAVAFKNIDPDKIS